MFDFSRITDAVESVLGGDNPALDPGALLQQVQDAGIDVSQFEGLAPEQILQTLSEQGFDLTQFDAGQFGEFAAQFGSGEGVTGALESLMDFAKQK